LQALTPHRFPVEIDFGAQNSEFSARIQSIHDINMFLRRKTW
jgi:hypothetical protein